MCSLGAVDESQEKPQPTRAFRDVVLTNVDEKTLQKMKQTTEQVNADAQLAQQLASRPVICWRMHHLDRSPFAPQSIIKHVVATFSLDFASLEIDVTILMTCVRFVAHILATDALIKSFAQKIVISEVKAIKSVLFVWNL